MRYQFAFYLFIVSLLAACDDAPLPVKKNIDLLGKSIAAYYAIEKKDERGPIRNYYVYVSDTTKIAAINDYLKGLYNSDGTNHLTIFYFDKKNIGSTYMAKVLNQKTSSKELDRLFKHFVGHYNFNPSTGDNTLSNPH